MTGFPWYVISLLGTITCLVLIDRRWSLVLWGPRAARSWIILAITATVFLAWDAIAIAWHSYTRGSGSAMLGIELAPHFPIEEIIFVGFFSYLALIVTVIATRIWRQP